MTPQLPSETTASSRKTYAYPGGTLHLVPWADLFAGSVLIWLVYFVGGPGAFKTKHGVFFIAFGLFWIFAGFHWEWSLRNQIGSVIVDRSGLLCTLPWGRQRHFRWNEIREVRCLGRRFEPGISAWEIRGATSKDKVNFTWELKGHKELLQIIKERATNCQHFDEIL